MRTFDNFPLLRASILRACADLDLDEWEKQGWASKPIAVAEGATYGHIERVHTDDLSVEAFRERFERANLPVLIGGVVDKWPAAENWEPERLSKRLRHRMFKCGEVSCDRRRVRQGGGQIGAAGARGGKNVARGSSRVSCILQSSRALTGGPPVL